MRVKDLEPKQLKELLTYMEQSGDIKHFSTPTELWNAPIARTVLWSETPQSADYWLNIVKEFNNKQI
jgi:hypothetical protein